MLSASLSLDSLVLGRVTEAAPWVLWPFGRFEVVHSLDNFAVLAWEAQEAQGGPEAQEAPEAQEPRAQGLRAQELRAREQWVQEPRAQGLRVQKRRAQGRWVRELRAQKSLAHRF